MTKQEFIEQAYGKYYPLVERLLTEDGFAPYALLRDSEGITFEFKEMHLIYGSPESYVRPKSLKGLETNNGWIKIESEKDLPKEHMSVFLFEPIDGIGIGSWCNLQMIFKTRFGNEYKPVTHYQPIIKPQKPLY